MILRFLLAVMLAVLPAIAVAQQAPDAGRKEQWLKEHAQVLADFRAEPAYVESDGGDYIHFLDELHRRVLLVTKPEHPAHPAVVVASLVEKDGGVAMEPKGVGRGNQQALQSWMDGLHELDPLLAKAIVAEAEQEKLLEKVRARPDVTASDAVDHVRIFDPKRDRVLLFTKAGHPAHPAVVTRQAIEKDGQLFMATNGVGTGSQVALKAWIDGMGEQDAELARAIRERSK